MSSDHTTKQCTKCGLEFPLTIEFWNKAKRYKDGFFSWCRKCVRDYRIDYQIKNKERRKIYMTEYNRKYYQTNREREQQRADTYRRNHPEQNREYSRKYRNGLGESDKVAARIYMANYYRKNAKRIKDGAKDWRRKNPHKVQVYSVHRKARYKNAEGSHTFDEIMTIFRNQEGNCFHCNADLILIGYHEDHWIPLSRGGSNWISNIRLLCEHCNLSKGAKLPCEWDSRYCD